MSTQTVIGLHADVIVQQHVNRNKTRREGRDRMAEVGCEPMASTKEKA